ncbi:MAG: 2-oxoacid:acceptor oxidoreductase family protein [Lachnospiraceae bacterium]|nr:2-oxoacid:acceptor oxidoreductase family protein [Lachnospiraceae bacterium]
MTTNYLFAGFGGQGILFSGKLLAYKGLTEGKNVSWLPSYGPEMRGGTASCSVIISDEPIGAPIVLEPDVLIAMNLPSLDRYESSVVPGGRIYADSSLIERKIERTDVDVCYIPATKIAAESGMEGLANMIIAGKIISDNGEWSEESIEKALGKCISARHADKLEINRKALKTGKDF